MVTTVMTPIALKLMYRSWIGASEPVTEPVSVALPKRYLASRSRAGFLVMH